MIERKRNKLFYTCLRTFNEKKNTRILFLFKKKQENLKVRKREKEVS